MRLTLSTRFQEENLPKYDPRFFYQTLSAYANSMFYHQFLFLCRETFCRVPAEYNLHLNRFIITFNSINNQIIIWKNTVTSNYGLNRSWKNHTFIIVIITPWKLYTWIFFIKEPSLKMILNGKHDYMWSGPRLTAV